MCRGYKRIFSARDVASDAVHRQILVSQYDAGECFDLDVFQRIALDLGKAAHLCLREPDVFDSLRLKLSIGRVDVGLRQPEIGWRPIVEF